MPKLIDPTPTLRESFLAAVAEFHQDHSYPVPWFISDVDPLALTDVVAFEAYVARVVGERAEAAARAIGFVPMTTVWLVVGEQMLGRLAIRRRPTPALEREGWHIGYDVRPSARRKGYATAMLAAGLPIARSLGIAEALLTCDDTNRASQRVIEGNGGRFIGMASRKRRYLVSTG